MRAICTGDLHFGAGTKFSDDRLGEQGLVWSKTLLLAREHECPVIVAGDVFHRPRPTPAEQDAFFGPIRAADDVAVHVCPGNHDWLAANQPTELAIWRNVLPNLIVVSEPRVTPVDDAAVGWLPWVPPHTLQAAEPGLTRDDLNTKIAQTLMLAARQLKADGAEVLVAHWSVSNTELPHGGLVQEFLREPILPVHELADLELPVVLAHIHKHQVLSSREVLNKTGFGRADGEAEFVERNHVFYVGSPMPLDFGEGGYEHGVVLLDTAGSTTFLPIESRPFVTIDHRNNPAAAQALALAGGQSVGFEAVPKDAVMRLRYTATREEQAKIDTAALVRGFERAGASRVYVLPEITKGVRARVQVEDDLGPVEALIAWMDANGLSSETNPGLIGLTDELLGEVGVA